MTWKQRSLKLSAAFPEKLSGEIFAVFDFCWGFFVVVVLVFCFVLLFLLFELEEEKEKRMD